MSRFFFPIASALLACLSVLSIEVGAAEPLDPQAVEFFEQKIRPVLVQQCYGCHSEAAVKNKKLKGDLFLDSRAGVLKGGESGPAVVVGKSAESLLLKALKYDGFEMPPTSKLPEAVIADFAKWIDMGLPDPRDGQVVAVKKREINIEEGRQFWSFQPLQQVTPPVVKNSSAVRTPVDQFVLAKQEEKGLIPNQMASKEKLARRAFYDLIGLPPTPEELQVFYASYATDGPYKSYEMLIDRLLASEHFGERWARHWLDVVRYAESGGYEFDGDRGGAYHYRDFVIKAFNQDLPFDQFVRWQLAGDKLLPGDYLAGSATGFLVAGPYPGQITAKTVERIRYDQLDDMVSTVGSSMLGLTLSCVRCHDHKYDPLPQQDYYKLLATISRVVSTDQKLDPQPEIYRQAKADWDQAHAPLAATWKQFEQEKFPDRLKAWRETELPKLKLSPAKWQIVEPNSATAAKATLTKQDDGSFVATGKMEANDTYTFVWQTHSKPLTALRLETLAHEVAPAKGPGLGKNGEFRLSRIELTAGPLDPANKTKPAAVKLKAVAATFEKPDSPLSASVDKDGKNGWSVGDKTGKDHAALYELEGEVGFEGGTTLTCVLKFEGNQFGIARPRLSFATATPPATLEGTAALQSSEELRLLTKDEKFSITDRNRPELLRWFRHFDTEANTVIAAVDAHLAIEPKPKLTNVFAVGPGGGDVFLLTRGEVDRKQGKATPGFINVLRRADVSDEHWFPKPPAGQPVTEPRIALADWMTDPDHGAGHLLARVMVNRLWRHHFGRGLVATVNDFGAQGERPSHPELLDYLATELIRGGWKLKPLHKLLLTSAVYMQGNEIAAANSKLDPDNRLLWHRPTRRLEGEVIRDAMLAVSGTLDPKLYGPGTLDANVARRSIYLTVKRSQMVPFLQLFDLPEPIQSIGDRSNTTVPTQALTLMNSPFVRQRAEKLAQRIKAAGGNSPDSAIDQAYLVTLSREPNAAEREKLRAFIDYQKQLLGDSPQTLDKAVVEICQLLLCLNEFVYID